MGPDGAEPEVAARALDLARRAGIELRSLPSGDGPRSHLFLLPAGDLPAALRLLHGAFVEAPRATRPARPPADRA